ncbi:MAG: InlB B-repeat-containing protein [Atopobiaceae bacterium]|nr:InlB B-repeat-containing protein [Atopobiaceae bacterium]
MERRRRPITIYGGEVTARGSEDAAGIGSGADHHGGGNNVTIYGGTVNAYGGSGSFDGGAGIGGGDEDSGGTIKIYGGAVYSKGGRDGAGIGGGDGGDGGTIEIHGGTVTAEGNDSAGIGGGQHDGAGGNGGNITITGGTVTATGNEGAGIGGGADGGSSGTIKISGGEVTAVAGVNSAGIGGGDDGACERVEITGGTIKEAKGGSTANSGGAGIGGGNAHDGGTIIISNANVTAQGGSDGAGIGGGDHASGGNITISANSLDYKIKATGGGCASGIGGGQNGDGGSVTINGGTVEATGATDSAGIGGGEKGNGGTVTITGGKVTAIGSPGNVSYEGGAGIGGGDGTGGNNYGNGGTVNISGGEVIAKGGKDAAGIGGGDQGNGGIVNISGGTVTATGKDYAAGIGGGDGDRSGTTSHGNGGTVTITGDAHVTATGGNSGAGIGSGEEGNTGGTVIIGTERSSTGPTVIATGGKYAAGIGAGDAWIQGGPYAKVDPKGADVTIYSGNVTANGGLDAAGIGGGEGASNGTTKIYGGTVEARAGQTGDYDGGAGIGSGDDAYEEGDNHTSGGTIEIYGGNVSATGGRNGAGIGGGDYGSGGTIKIAGGTVTANGGAQGAGIGGGRLRGAQSVTITGGYVRATGGSNEDGDKGGAGIGGGGNIASVIREENNDPGPAPGTAIGEDVINISGNCTVVAQGGICAAGIGGGIAGAPGSVTIAVDDNCTVDAIGGIHAAGIGGGRGNDSCGKGNTVNYGVSGNITINSGIVTAIGGKNGGPGIGSGAACGDSRIDTVKVTINGGSVIARAGEITEDSQYDSGVAIGSGGKYYKDEMKKIVLDDDGDFVIEDEEISSKFTGAITFNGGHVVAQAAHAPESLEEYLDGALNVIGASRDLNATGGRVDFNGGTVWMWTGGFSNGSATKYSQAVRAGTDDSDAIYFTDDPEHQNVFYVLVPEDGKEYEDEKMENAGESREQRIYALTKYDEVKHPNNYGLVVVKPQHDHQFTYTAEGDTITATCSRQSCTLPGHKATLKIKKPLHAKYDDGLTDNDGEKATIEDPYMIQGNSEIEYYNAKADGTGPEGSELVDKDGNPAPPLGAGTYWAQITLREGTNSATAHVLYTIEKANSPAHVASNAGIIMADGQSELAFVDLSKNIKYNESIDDYLPGDQPVTYQIDGENANGCHMGTGPADYGTLYASESTQEGQVVVKVTVPEDNNYKSLEANITVTISKKPQRSVTATLMNDEAESVDSITYGQEALVLGSVDPKTPNDKWTLMVDPGYKEFIEIDEDDIAVDEEGNTLPHIKAKKAGVAYIIAMVEDSSQDPSYAPSYAEVKVTITPAPATIKPKNESISQGDTPKGEYEVKGLVGDDTIGTPPTLTYWQGQTQVDPSTAWPGKYTIKAEGAADGNYAFTYGEPGTLTVRANQLIYASMPNVTYGDTDKRIDADASGDGTLSYAVTGGSEDYISVDPETGALRVIKVPENGLAYVTITAAQTDDYNQSIRNVPVRISKKPLIVKAGDLKSYVGDSVPNLDTEGTYEAIGLLKDDALAVEPALHYEPIFPPNNVGGTYNIVPSGAQAENYAITYESGTLTVKDRKIQEITASDLTVTYGDANRYVDATTNGDGALSYRVSSGDAVSVNSQTGELTIVKSGNAYVSIVAQGTDDYTPATKEIVVRVRRAQLSVTAKDEQIYTGDTPLGRFDVDGLVGGDTLEMVSPTITYQKDGVAIDPTTAPAGNYDIVPSGVDIDGKYTVGYVNGKLTIRADQAITAPNVTVTYGDTGQFVKATTSGDGALSYAVKEGGEFIDVVSTTGELRIKRAGIAKVTVTAAETSNCAQASRDVTVKVNKKQATIQADDQVECIGNIDDVGAIKLTAKVSGVVNKDTLAYGLSCDFGSPVKVGPHDIIISADPNVEPNYNYEITRKTGKFTVTSTNITALAEGWTGAYNGEPHGITVNVNVPTGTDYTVAFGTAKDAYDSIESPTQTDAGSLTVYYKVTASPDTIFYGSKDVIVEKAPISPTVSIEGWAWGEEPKAPQLGESSNPGNGKVTYEYAHKGGSDWSATPPTAHGNYTVLAIVPETANYLGGRAVADFQVTPKAATLTYELDGGTLDRSTGSVTQSANSGDTVKLAGAPTKDGFVFKGWSADGKEYTPGADYKVTGDQSFKATWQKESETESQPDSTKATLTFNLGEGALNGKTGTVTIDVTKGSTIIMPAPTRDGYEFDHWEGSKYYAGDEYKVEGDHKFTAVWKEKSNSSTIDDSSSSNTGGKSGGAAETLTDGSSGGGTTNTLTAGGSGGTTNTLTGGGSGGSASTLTGGGSGGSASTLTDGSSGGKATSSSPTAKTGDPALPFAIIGALGAAAAFMGVRNRKK